MPLRVNPYIGCGTGGGGTVAGIDPACVFSNIVIDDIQQRLEQRELLNTLAMENGNMGFLDGVLEGIKKAGEIIGSAAPVVIGAVGAVQQVQNVLNGKTGPAAAAGAGAMPAMMAMGGGAATQGSAEQAAFAAACNADPTGQCQAAIAAALSGMGGGMTPGMLNGGDLSEAELLAAGVPAQLVMALRGGGQAALNVLRQFIPGLAVGAVGAAAGSALTTSLQSSSGARFPRALFIPDPRGGVREYKYRGRPVLYSGDIAAARRVVKIAKRARSARGGVRRRQSATSQILMLPGGTACGKCGNGACAGC